VKGIREPELEKITATVMGTESFNPDAFRASIDHITMEQGGVLTFAFIDGETKTASYSTKRKGTPWTQEQREKFSQSAKASYTPERRKAASERMKQMRKEKTWQRNEK